MKHVQGVALRSTSRGVRTITPVQQRRLFAVAKALGMTDVERGEFTEMFLKVDNGSWGAISAADAARLVDAFEGYALITALIGNRAVTYEVEE